MTVRGQERGVMSYAAFLETDGPARWLDRHRPRARRRTSVALRVAARVGAVGAAQGRRRCSGTGGQEDCSLSLSVARLPRRIAR